MNSESSSTVVEAIADELAHAGVDRVFGLPGGEVLQLMDALRRKNIEFTLCRHEAHAGIMAAVYGKLRGTVGVVITTLGPGAANLMLPLTNSLLDREPLLAISADLPESWPGAHTHQRLPLQEMFGPVTKFSASMNQFNVRRNIRRAIASSTEEPFGPSYLTVSAEVATKPSFEHAGTPQSPWESSSHLVSGIGDPKEAAERLFEKLKQSERPLVLLGLGARPEICDSLRTWLQQWNLPVAVTPKVKGLVDESAPNFVGVVGGMSIDSLILQALEEADLLVGFGFDPVESDKTWHARLPITWVLESPMAADVVPHENLIGVQHDALLEVLLKQEPPRRWGDLFGDVKERRRSLFNSFTAASSCHSGHDTDSDSTTIYPVALVRTLAQTLPDNTVIVTDVGAHKYLFGQFWPSKYPETFFMSNGLSGMGYGLPGAIAAKLARPESPVLAVVGDGGFSMFSQELETASRIGAQVNVVVLADRSYSLIRMGQASRGLSTYGVDFDPIDTIQTAEACGIRGLRAASVEEAAAALHQAVQAGESLVVEVPLDPITYKELV